MADATEQTKKLSPKQEAFLAAYLGSCKFNATKAATVAGYEFPNKQGPRLLLNVGIASRVREELTILALPAEAVLSELAEVASAEWMDFIEIVRRDKTGNPIVVKMDLTAKVKALELLGKHHQLFTDNVNITGLLKHDHRIRDFSAFNDDELESLERLALKVGGDALAEDGF